MAQTVMEGFAIWFTGMSGAGKSTLANYIGARLMAAGRRVEILDGDDAGKLLGYELGETPDDRDLATRRIGFVAELLSRNGVVAIGATISPHRSIREDLRRDIGRFVEVFVDCDVETLIERDVKGLYKKALAGELPRFIGITEAYEPPKSPEVTIDSANESVQDSAEAILGALHRLQFLSEEEVRVALFGKTKEAAAERRKAARKAEAAARATSAASKPKPKPKSKSRGAASTAKDEPKPESAEPQEVEAAEPTKESKGKGEAAKSSAKSAEPKKKTSGKAAKSGAESAKPKKDPDSGKKSPVKGAKKLGAKKKTAQGAKAGTKKKSSKKTAAA